MSAHPAAPASAPQKPPTYADLWQFADRARVQAESLVDGYAADLDAAKHAGDRLFYARRLADLTRDAACTLALQKLVERCERSDVIKAELKRIAADEHGAIDSEQP